jgi:leucyl aminopeptidase
MILKKATAKPQEYSIRILPFPAAAANSTKIPEGLPETLKAQHLPAAGQWLLWLNDQPTLLFAYDSMANHWALSKAFRNMAVQTLAQWGDKPLLDTSLMGGHLETGLRGMVAAQYQIGFYKSSTSVKWPKSLHLSGNEGAANEMQRAQTSAEVYMRVLELVDLPPNTKTPEYLGQWARKSAKTYGFECEVWNDKRITSTGLHALHAVGKGSDHEPIFIISRYQGVPASAEVHLALVGKGITFDTGGVSIKDSANLHYMKSDMAGGAVMLGAIELAARLKLPLNITAVVPVAENVVDSRSLLPGDVIQSYSGKTIEIIDTDAEGRLILADALAWTVKNIQPKVLVDMATLTGSSLRALGTEAAALYTDNTVLQDMLTTAGQKTGEKLWPMPLWSDYDNYIHSDIADVSNLPLKPVAGSIAAAKFLQVFTLGHTAWAHIDMPGQSFGDSPFAKMKSATGYGLQLLSEVMQQFIENTDIRKQLTIN